MFLPARETQNARQKFEERVSADGRFASYARGRLSYFLGRQVLTFIGAAILGFLVSPQLGFAALLVALFGEAVDCFTLRAFVRRGNYGRRAQQASIATAAVQATTISICVWLGWCATSGPEARFFAVVYMCGAVINAGLVYPFHRRATEARLVVYIFAIASLFAMDGLTGRGSQGQLIFDFLATLMLGYMAYTFIRFVLRSHNKRIVMERDLIRRQHMLDQSFQTLEARAREARQLAMVAANANDSVIVTDREGRIEYTNASFTRVSGYTAEEALGQLPADLLNSPNTDTEAIAAIFKARDIHEPVRMELINRTKSGEDIWVETNITPMVDDDGVVQGEVAIERDITQAKRREKELADAKTAAEEGARAKAQFLAMVSHEIRTPLNGIIGMSDVLLSGSLQKDQRETVQTILSSGEALLTIINDILDLSKLEAGKMEIETIPFDLRAQLQGALALVHPLAEEKGLALSLTFDDLPADEFLGDPGRVRQVFLNLMGNAIKFTKSGGVSARVSIATGPQGDEIRIAVQDTGIGIPEDRLAHIFAAFAQADGATTRHFGGTGLGLAISRQLARQMGGDIDVTSAPGQGSCFTLRFRTQAAASAHKAATCKATAGIAGIPADIRILVADDNRTNRLLLGKLLDKVKPGLIFAVDGIEAVEKFRSEGPDLILMDMSMPRCDGIEATRLIREIEALEPAPAVPILALTANAFASDRDRCLEAGMDGFLTKPIRRRDLFAAIAEFAPDQSQTDRATTALKTAAL
ncbi:ATP-binding protein [Dinoroseobacter sp. S76]|uniref:PAS domain-containing hybrid sensor histidine kinase/response regulator n=1 Tax=Dinoroseobacter sp. S76 TaxID=3415124 RepID=UPI003C7BBCA1